MDDILILVSHLLVSNSADKTALLAFVRLQATHRAVWLHFKNDHALWRKLGASLPQWSLPEHMGLRRRVITGIKLLMGRCIACGGKARRVFMAFQARLCGACCHRLLISDFEFAWGYGVELPDNTAPYIVRYIGHIRVRFFMKQHLKRLAPSQDNVRLTREQVFAFMRRWPALNRQHVKLLVDRMG